MKNDSGHVENLTIHLSNAGLLPSHAYLGSFFFVLGTWWCFAIIRSAHRTRKVSRAALSLHGKCAGSCSAQLIEGLAKLIACLVGLVIERIAVSYLGRNENYTYSTLYVGLLLASFIDILTACRVVLPEGIDFLAHAVTFANLAVLTRSHAWGHLHLTVATRMLTSYVATFVTLAIILELYKPDSLIVKFIRSGAVMVQGVFFWHAGLVLDSPLGNRWKETEHSNLMFITIAFVLDIFAVMLFQTFLAVITEKMCGRQEPRLSSRLKRSEQDRGNVMSVEDDAVEDWQPLKTAVVEESGDHLTPS